MPTLAPDAGADLPTVVATGYHASATPAGRLRAMTSAAVRPGALRATLETAEVVHYPLTVPVPRVSRPTVVTLLDVQHLDLPELFPLGERLFRRLAYDRASRRADQVIVISQWVRERTIERLELDPERVHAIHLGVDLARFSTEPAVVREPFVLYPARPWPHKNHARLFEAFEAVRAAHPELRLVLTGEGNDTARLPTGVEALGSVSRDELVSLYRRAAGTRVPEPLRGLRVAAARGNGLRLSGRGVGRRLAPRGVRRCRGALRPLRHRCDRGRDRASSGPRVRALGGGSGTRRVVHVGRDGPRP